MAQQYRICLQHRRGRFNPWVGKILWRREWQPTPVSLLENSHRQRSLMGYGPWGHKSWTRLSTYTAVIILTALALNTS